ncbi:MAG: nitrogen regulation protein NR(I) [Alphaproteobacteria bacterium]|nr:nitrogen regulation protein NR(I) [Alphaproteobacteria bacterium]
MAATILIADDDTSICTVLSHAVARKGWIAKVVHDGESLLKLAERGEGDVVVTDVRMPVGEVGKDGLDLLPALARIRPELPVIVISAQNTLMTAVRANQVGAYEYLPKPFDLDVLMAHIEKSLEKKVVAVPAAKSEEQEYFVGTSPAIQDIYRQIARLVDNDLTVTIIGESGTGKELIASALHSLGARKHAAFVAINMAAIPRELVESELFGYEKGAFTGANQRKSGKFEQAEGGTLFLDEIGDMPMDAQTKLLRVLQQGEFTTVGGTKMVKSNVRIVCATHRDLMQLVKSGDFREDLYYRLQVVPLKIPPLRERKEDILPLAEFFLKKAAAKGLSQKTLDAQALWVLQNYNWPGNVRELEHMLYRLCALSSDGVITAEAVAQEMRAGDAKGASGNDTIEQDVRAHLKLYFNAHGAGALPPPGLYDRILPLLERPLIEMTLQATGGNQVKAAHVLGINRNTLRKKITELQIDIELLTGGHAS